MEAKGLKFVQRVFNPDYMLWRRMEGEKSSPHYAPDGIYFILSQRKPGWKHINFIFDLEYDKFYLAYPRPGLFVIETKDEAQQVMEDLLRGLIGSAL